MDIAPFARAGRFWRGNLHTHSTRSDGRLPPEAVAAFYRDAGYDFLALTDHFWAVYDYPVTDTRAFRSKNFATLLGAEIHAPVTSKGHDWHVAAVGLPLDFAPWTSGETMQVMSRRAAEAGAFLGIAHPQWYGLTPEDALSLPLAHAVEVYNHGCAIDCDRGDGFVVLEEMLAAGKRLHAYAADDAHFATPDAGGGWVMVKAEALEPELLLQALKRGDFYSSQGPRIDNIFTNGSQVTVACSPAISVSVAGSGTGSRSVHGQDLTRAALSLDPFGDDGYFRITVTDERGRRAWSNPIWRRWAES
jgi:predicted metal-dependent phosphoesterase TrpH